VLRCDRLTVHIGPFRLHNLPTTRVGPLFAQVPAAVHRSVRAGMAALVAHKATRLIAVSRTLNATSATRCVTEARSRYSPSLMSPPSRRPVLTVGWSPNEGTSFLTILSSWARARTGPR
jgi:hypothetical protein